MGMYNCYVDSIGVVVNTICRTIFVSCLFESYALTYYSYIQSYLVNVYFFQITFLKKCRCRALVCMKLVTLLDYSTSRKVHSTTTIYASTLRMLKMVTSSDIFVISINSCFAVLTKCSKFSKLQNCMHMNCALFCKIQMD